MPSFSGTMLLKPGGHWPPLFFLPGLSGSIAELSRVVEEMPCTHPIYGMQPLATEGATATLETIEGTAQAYLDAIRGLQPNGPYAFVGYSFGGLVALEIAQQLREAGEMIALLVMIDSYPHDSKLAARQRLYLAARRMGRRLGAVVRMSPRDVGAYILRKRSNRMEAETPAPQVRKAADLALMRYRSRFYAGKVKFVRAQIGTRFPKDPVAVWSDLIQQFDVDTCPGDHTEILTTHAVTLVSLLSRYINEAIGATGLEKSTIV